MPKQLVLIAEGIMCSLFSSFSHEIYRKLRLPGLPFVDCKSAVNRSDPLAPEGHCLTDQKQRQQQSTLKNALAGGPQNVHLKRQENGTIRYAFSVFELDFELPYQLGDEWGLGTSAFVQVTFDVSTTEHDFHTPYYVRITMLGVTLGFRSLKS